MAKGQGRSRGHPGDAKAVELLGPLRLFAQTSVGEVEWRDAKINDIFEGTAANHMPDYRSAHPRYSSKELS